MHISVGEVMTGDVVCVSADMSVREAERLLLERRVSGAPVLDGPRVVGVVSIVDVLWAFHEEHLDRQRVSAFYLSPFSLSLPSLEQFTPSSGPTIGGLPERRVRDVMTPHLLTVSSADPVATAAERMMDHRVHRLVVIDEGRLVGIVTALDLLRLVAQPAPGNSP
jgi:CBS domain-containing protein